MLPPPLLFFGLNNMYTDNFTNWQLSLPYTETIGGLQMEPKDAMRIAKYSKIGKHECNTITIVSTDLLLFV